MFEFEIKSPVDLPTLAKKHLHRYQARDLLRSPQIEGHRRKLQGVRYTFLMHMENPLKAGEAVGQQIECMDGSFEVHEWCLYQSDFLLSFFEGPLFNKAVRASIIIWSLENCNPARNCEYRKAQGNFDGESKKRKFILKQFRKTSIQKVYDSLHGISNEAVPISNAVEMMAYCLIDGKVEQGSVFETNLYNDLVKQLIEMKDGFTVKLSLI